MEQAAGQGLRLVAEEEDVSGWVSVGRVILLDRAIEIYSEEIRARPSAESYNNRGLLSTARGDYDRAITDISEAIRLKPEYGPGVQQPGPRLVSQGSL